MLDLSIELETQPGTCGHTPLLDQLVTWTIQFNDRIKKPKEILLEIGFIEEMRTIVTYCIVFIVTRACERGVQGVRCTWTRA